MMDQNIAQRNDAVISHNIIDRYNVAEEFLFVFGAKRKHNVESNNFIPKCFYPPPLPPPSSSSSSSPLLLLLL